MTRQTVASSYAFLWIGSTTGVASERTGYGRRPWAVRSRRRGGDPVRSRPATGVQDRQLPWNLLWPLIFGGFGVVARGAFLFGPKRG